MIHVLKAPIYVCQAFAGLFASCFSECGAVFGSSCNVCIALCSGVIEMLQTILDFVCGLVRSVFNIDGPLGGLVLLALVLNVPSLMSAVQNSLNPHVVHCTAAPAAGFLTEDAVLAVVHLGFAVYFKGRVDGTFAAQAAAEGGQVMPAWTMKQVRQEVRKIALYDIGFALYFFFFCYAFIRNCQGVGIVNRCRHGNDGVSTTAPVLQIIYASLAIQYMLFWSCVQGIMSWLEEICPCLRWRRSARIPQLAVGPVPVQQGVPGVPAVQAIPAQALRQDQANHYVALPGGQAAPPV